MSPVANQKAPQARLRLSEEMKEQLETLKTSRSNHGKGADRITVLTFESNLDSAVPDPVVMWEKSTCC